MAKLTATALADELGVSTSTLYRWVQAGAPHQRTLGGHLRFDLEDVETWLEEQQTAPRDDDEDDDDDEADDELDDDAEDEDPDDADDVDEDDDP